MSINASSHVTVSDKGVVDIYHHYVVDGNEYSVHTTIWPDFTNTGVAPDGKAIQLSKIDARKLYNAVMKVYELTEIR